MKFKEITISAFLFILTLANISYSNNLLIPKLKNGSINLSTIEYDLFTPNTSKNTKEFNTGTSEIKETTINEAGFEIATISSPRISETEFDEITIAKLGSKEITVSLPGISETGIEEITIALPNPK